MFLINKNFDFNSIKFLGKSFIEDLRQKSSKKIKIDWIFKDKYSDRKGTLKRSNKREERIIDRMVKHHEKILNKKIVGLRHVQGKEL